MQAQWSSWNCLLTVDCRPNQTINRIHKTVIYLWATQSLSLSPSLSLCLPLSLSVSPSLPPSLASYHIQKTWNPVRITATAPPFWCHLQCPTPPHFCPARIPRVPLVCGISSTFNSLRQSSSHSPRTCDVKGPASARGTGIRRLLAPPFGAKDVPFGGTCASSLFSG